MRIPTLIAVAYSTVLTLVNVKIFLQGTELLHVLWMICGRGIGHPHETVVRCSAFRERGLSPRFLYDFQACLFPLLNHIGTEDSTKTAPKGRNSTTVSARCQRLLNAGRE